MAGQGGVLQAGQQGIGLAFDETTCDEFVARVRDSGLVSEEQVGDGELRSIFDEWDADRSGKVQKTTVEDYIHTIETLTQQLHDARLARPSSGDGAVIVLEELLQQEIGVRERATKDLETKNRENDDLKSDLEAERLRCADLLIQLQTSQAGGSKGKNSTVDAQWRSQLATMEHSWKATLRENKELKKQKKKAAAEREHERGLLEQLRSELTSNEQELHKASRAAERAKQSVRQAKKEVAELKQQKKMSDESALNDAAYREENAVAQHRQRREAAERDNQKLQKRVTAAIADAKAERQRREELEVENEQLQRQLLEAKERVAQLEREKAQEDAQPDVRESQPEPQPPEPQPEPQPETQPEPQLAPRRSPGGRKPEPQLALRRSPGERKLEQHPDAAKVQPAVAGPEVQPGVAPADLPQPLFNGLWHARGDFDGHDQNPFNESFVLYEDPRSGKLSGVSYFGKRCNDAGYPPPPVPELFTISGETDVSDGQRTECRFTQTFVDEESGIEQTVWHGKLVEGEVTAIRGKWRSKASGQSGTFEAVEDLGVFPTVLLRLDMSGPYVEQETSPGPEPELVEEAKAVLLQQLRDQVKAEHLDDEDDLLECIQTLQVHVDSGTGPFDISIRIGFSPQSLIVAQSLSAQVDYFREKATAGHVAILVGPKRFTSRGLETDFFETGTHGEEWASFHHELSRATAAHPHSQEPSGLLDSLQQQGKMAERDDPTLATMTNSSVPYVQQHLRSDGQLSHSTHHLRIIPGYEDSSHIQPTHSVSTYQSPIEVPAWDKLRAELEELRPHALLKRAREEGVDETRLEEADWGEDGRDATIELILARVKEEEDKAILLAEARSRVGRGDLVQNAPWDAQRMVVPVERSYTHRHDAHKQRFRESQEGDSEITVGGLGITMHSTTFSDIDATFRGEGATNHRASKVHETLRRVARDSSFDEDSAEKDHEAEVAKSFVDAAAQQMDRCYALHVEGFASLGEEFDQLRLRLLEEAGISQDQLLKKQNKLTKNRDDLHLRREKAASEHRHLHESELVTLQGKIDELEADIEAAPARREGITARMRKAWVATTFPAGTAHTSQKRVELAEKFLHVHKETDDKSVWGLSTTREWFQDGEGQSHSEAEVRHHDQGSFNGIYTAKRVDSETGHVEFVHDSRGFPIYQNECGRYLYRTVNDDPSAQRWVFSRKWQPGDGKVATGVASTRTGNGAVPTGTQSWKGKEPPPLKPPLPPGKPRTDTIPGTVELQIAELFMKPGFAEDPKRRTECTLPNGKRAHKLNVYRARDKKSLFRPEATIRDDEHPEYGARCVLEYNEEHACPDAPALDGKTAIHHKTGIVQLADSLGREHPFFEVEILSDGVPEIAIGLSYLLKEHAEELEELPGWYPGSVGYHFDNYDLCENGTGTIKVPTRREDGTEMPLKKGDKVLCGLEWSTEDGGWAAGGRWADGGGTLGSRHVVWFAVQRKGDKLPTEIKRRATLCGYPNGGIGEDSPLRQKLYPTIGMSRCTGHGLAVKVFLGVHQPGQSIGKAFSPPIETSQAPIKTKHEKDCGMAFRTVRQGHRTYVVLCGLPDPKSPAGMELRMGGLREGMVLVQAGHERLEELLESRWRNHSSQEILEEVQKLCDSTASGHHAVKDVTLAFQGRFEALSKPDDTVYPVAVDVAKVDVKTLPSDATTLHSGTAPTTSRPKSHRKELEDRIIRLERRRKPEMTQAQEEDLRRTLTPMVLSELKKKATELGLHTGSYNSPVRANSAALHPSKRALRR